MNTRCFKQFKHRWMISNDKCSPDLSEKQNHVFKE